MMNMWRGAAISCWLSRCSERSVFRRMTDVWVSVAVVLSGRLLALNTPTPTGYRFIRFPHIISDITHTSSSSSSSHSRHINTDYNPALFHRFSSLLPKFLFSFKWFFCFWLFWIFNVCLCVEFLAGNTLLSYVLNNHSFLTRIRYFSFLVFPLLSCFLKIPGLDLS